MDSENTTPEPEETGGDSPKREGEHNQSGRPSQNGESEKSPVEVPIQLIDQIELAFSEVSVSRITSRDYSFELISLSELPMETLVKMANSSGKGQVMMMRKFVKMCLVNPEQWEELKYMNFEQFTDFVKTWMYRSGAVTSGDEEQEEDYDE